MIEFNDTAHLPRILVGADDHHHLEFMFRSVSGKPTMVCVGFEVFGDYRKLMSILRAKGYGGPFPTREKLSEIEEAIITYATSPEGRERTIFVASKGGWSDDLSSFRMGNLELPAGRQLPSLPEKETEVWSRKGTFEGWQQSVAFHALYSSAMLLAISACFVGPVLRLVGTEAGGFGFNILGKPGTGKSTALRAAASTLSGHYAATGDATVQGLQDTVQEYCDLPTVIDSVESMPTDRRTALLEMIAHVCTNGIPRRRNSAWAAEHRVDTKRFRAVVLMSEEDTVIMRTRQSGAAVRLIDIPVSPADGGTNGVVDYIPVRIANEERRAFAKHIIEVIRNGADNHYGWALPIFVKKLIIHRDRALVRFQRYQSLFRADPNFSYLNVQQDRMLQRFAQSYAAGRLAADMHVVPWGKQHNRFRVALVQCALAAMSRFANTTGQAERDARRILDWLTDPVRIWAPDSQNLTRKEMNGIDFVKFHQNRQVFVRGEKLSDALGLSKGQMTAAAKCLLRMGRLSVETRSDSLTSLRRFADGTARVYVIRL